MPNAAWAAMTVAPVWPALNNAAVSPRATVSAATRIDAPGFRRSAADGISNLRKTYLKEPRDEHERTN